MRILLPPSETKRPGGDGLPLSEIGYGPRALASTRRRLLAAVARLCRHQPEKAVELLKLPPAVAMPTLAANTAVRATPTMPALDRFRGTLYEAFDAPSLDLAARQVALDSILIFDGAFGVLAGGEPVPDHRLPASASLPGLGGVTSLWRPVLQSVLPKLAAGHLVVDLRSADYAAMWRAGDRTEPPVIAVRILVERSAGGTAKRAVLSVPSKVGKGRLARALCDCGRDLGTVDELADVAKEAGFGVGEVSARALDLVFDFVPQGSGPRSPDQREARPDRPAG